jgi:glycosyltransferase involved in cell wall biosynthesis
MKARHNSYSPYVLITPARNEEAFIEKTIGSVISQTILPEKWVIVSDGSTDRTDEIVKGYAFERPWMKLIRRTEATDRNFASKVFCFNAGYEQVKDTRYDIIGNLDADLSFEKDYMEYLLDKFARDPELGVAGTPFVQEAGTHYDYSFTNIEHVSGGCQIFRRECFESIGGYAPIKGGGIDWVAVTMARKKGWKTRTFTDMTAYHHREMGTGTGSVLSAKFRLGREDYYLGSHPLWAFLRAFYQMKYKPYVLGGLVILLGYAVSAAKGIERPVPEELVAFYRKEQLTRLRRMIALKFNSDSNP